MVPINGTARWVVIIVGIAVLTGGTYAYSIHPLRLPPSTRAVLGTTRPESTTSQETSELERQYAEWKKVVEGKPDYRDGYYTLAVLAYRLGRFNESRNYLDVVKKLDPNYSGIDRLDTLLRTKE